MSGLNLLYKLLLKDVVKGSGQASGIMSIGGDIRKLADKKFQSYVMSAQKQGVDLDKLSEQEIKYILELNRPKAVKAISADSPEGEILTRDLFNMLDRRSGKNVIKTDFGGGVTDIVTETITKIKTLKPIDAMKEANSVIGRKGKYKRLTQEQSKKILQDTEDHIFERDIPIDPEDFAHGGRTGSGLNYMLGEDDQNSRVPFAMGKRAFLKWIGSGIAGVGAAKSGLFGLLKGGGKKKVVEEVVKQCAGAGTPPAYFFNLVKKIKNLGDDTVATQDKAVAKKYKDYTMQEDFAGNIEIMKKGDDVAEDVFMSYKVDNVPVKGKKKSTKVEEYEEYTATPDQDGKMKNIEQGVPDEVVQEGTVFEDTIAEFTKKASGGRVPLAGGLAGMLGE